MNFTPLFDRVLVEVTAPAAKTAGGLYLPSTTQEKIKQGRVLAVGPGVVQNGKLVPTNVKVDQEVTFQNGVGLEITIELGKYLLLREVDILGILG